MDKPGYQPHPNRYRRVTVCMWGLMDDRSIPTSQQAGAILYGTNKSSVRYQII
jgi:hypothetical protein